MGRAGRAPLPADLLAPGLRACLVHGRRVQRPDVRRRPLDRGRLPDGHLGPHTLNRRSNPMPKTKFLFSYALIGSLSIAGAALAADEVGRVSAVGGTATAQQPGGEPRALSCGDPVFAGDTL